MTITTLTVASIILYFCLILVMANEFPSLPKKLVNLSDAFSLQRKDRSLFVVFIITTLAIATGLNIVRYFNSFYDFHPSVMFICARITNISRIVKAVKYSWYVIIRNYECKLERMYKTNLQMFLELLH
jgi:adenylate cyclase 8